MRRELRRGLIIYAHFPEIDHPKYFIFVGIDPNGRLAHGFFINSQPPSIAKKNRRILSLQVEVRPESYGFLSHKSFINCAEFYTMPFLEMVNGLIENPSKIRGHLIEHDLKLVIQAALQSPLLKKAEKHIATSEVILLNF